MSVPAATFTADGTGQDLALHLARQLALTLGLPAALWLFFRTPLQNALVVAGVGAGMTGLLTWGRRRWGRKLTVGADRLQVLRHDGEVLDIPFTTLTALRVKPDVALFAWQAPGSEKRSLVLGRDCFQATTWRAVQQALQSVPVPGTPAAASSWRG